MDWYYYNINNEKIGPITVKALKELAAQGYITPETIIENTNGRTAVAGKVGLVFPKTTEAPPDRIYELVTPSPPAEPNPFVATPLVSDPFAAIAPPMNQAMPQQVAMPFIKKKRHSVLIAVGGILFLLFVLGIISSKQDDDAKPIKNSEFSLKKPPEQSVFVKAMVKTFGMKFPGLDEERLEKRFSGYWLRAQGVFDIGGAFHDQNLLGKMSLLQQGYDYCAELIVYEWSASVTYSFYPDTNSTLAIVATAYADTGCTYNLEQMMASITKDVDRLDETEYESTIKLFIILSKYEKIIKQPITSSTLNSDQYTSNKKALQAEFTQAMSLAKLEW